MNDLISTEDAATILGVSYRTVIRMAKSGQIVGKLLSKQWVISRVSVEEYKQAHQGPKEGSTPN